MHRLLVASFLALACIAGIPLLASEPAEVTAEETCQTSNTAEVEVTQVWSPHYSQAAMSSDMQLQQSGPHGKSSVQPCYSLGQIRYIQTSYCCSNGKLREIKETCAPQYGSWGTWVWKYSGVYCIGLFCNSGGGGSGSGGSGPGGGEGGGPV